MLEHDFIHALITTGLNGSESRLLWVIFALTRGYQKEREKITLALFAKATGLYENQAFDSLKQLGNERLSKSANRVILGENRAGKPSPPFTRSTGITTPGNHRDKN